MACTTDVRDIRKNDIGSTFLLTITDDCVALDVSTATVMQIKFKKPDDTVLTKTAINYTDGTDGKIKYITILNDLDAIGKWSVQAYVEMGGGKWHSTVGTFTVYDNL